jgi:putative hydrolase
MNDNLFDRLADLFKASGPVNWRLAREIAESSAGPAEPLDPWLVEEYAELAGTAAMLIEPSSPLDAAAHSAITAMDRRTWASQQPEGFGYLAEPLAAKLTGSMGGEAGMLAPLGPAIVGLQVGGLVGAMSQRVLAGFDIGIPAEPELPGAVLIPNVEDFAEDHGLDARQVRLWVAIHEITHTAAMAIPWVREQAVMRVEAYVETLEVDEEGLEEKMALLQDPQALEGMIDGSAVVGGLMGLVGDARALEDVTALMAAVEGYGDLLVKRTAANLVPEAPQLREALDRARAEPSPGERMLVHMIGLDLQHARYRLGGEFCSEIQRRWGDEAVDRLWEGPEFLPQAGELEDPVGWAARVLL